MDFSDICELIEKWKYYEKEISRFENKCDPYHNNVKRVLDLFTELAGFLEINLPRFQTWIMAYLEKHRLQIFVSWWNNHVSTWAESQIKNNFPDKHLHPETERIWDSVFGDSAETRFSLAKAVVEKMREQRLFKYCDDLTILAHHEGKPCESNGWYCDMCETQEERWHTELKRRALHSYHPLLNKDRSTYLCFWTKQLPEHMALWTPPHAWGTIYTERESFPCYDISQYEEYITESRKKTYAKDGQTPIQATKDFLFEALYHGGWRINFYKTDEYDTFVALWNKLELIPISIRLDMPRIQQIREML
jgi:hypothetical protein